MDYVNFYPGEPVSSPFLLYFRTCLASSSAPDSESSFAQNGNRCDTAGHQGNYCSAVSIDMRGYMGDLGMDLDPAVGARGRNGAWNDDSRNAGTMLYPICQSTIPQSEMSPTGRHMWGNGMSSSFNLRVCIQASDTLFFQVCPLPVCLPVCLCVCVSVCLCLSLSVCLSACLSACLPACPPARLSARLLACPPASMSVEMINC